VRGMYQISFIRLGVGAIETGLSRIRASYRKGLPMSNFPCTFHPFFRDVLVVPTFGRAL
jgi:hypothetical protein